jgi:hypothetical protein
LRGIAQPITGCVSARFCSAHNLDGMPPALSAAVNSVSFGLICRHGRQQESEGS